MSVSGLCQICQTRTAQHRCENCGTFACDRHFETGIGLCADCAAQARPGEVDDEKVHRF